MKIQKVIICEHCDKPIEPQDGFIIQGNIYVVTEDSVFGDRSQVIGDNFPWPTLDSNNDYIVLRNEINEVAWHKQCLIRYLSESLGETLR